MKLYTSLPDTLPLITQATKKFGRRSLLPLKENYLWRIETGAVRSLTWSQEGTIIPLGLWGPGDVVGRALSKANPYRIECLTVVEATLLPIDQWGSATDAFVLHIQRYGEFLEIMHGKPVDASLSRLLSWLAHRFGREVERGHLIELRLTHQEIAEFMGVSRVTVTRLLNNFEKQGIIERLHRHFVVIQDQQPFWHYEI